MGTMKKDKHGLTDKERRFIVEYCVDYSSSRAALAAGYAHPKVAGSKLLKRPHVKAAIERIAKEDAKNAELTKEEILKQLYFLVTREAGEYMDERNEIRRVHDMSERARNCIDGIEQDIIVNPRTGERTVRTKVKLTGKEGAVNLAMKHKGLFAAEQKEITHVVDWETLYQEPATKEDTIEGEIVRAALPAPSKEE